MSMYTCRGRGSLGSRPRRQRRLRRERRRRSARHGRPRAVISMTISTTTITIITNTNCYIIIAQTLFVTFIPIPTPTLKAGCRSLV